MDALDGLSKQIAGSGERMVDDDLRRAKEFRETAGKLRALARQVQSPDARRDLMELANRFDRMARQIDPENPAELD